MMVKKDGNLPGMSFIGDATISIFAAQDCGIDFLTLQLFIALQVVLLY